MSYLDRRAGDITREEFHDTITAWLATYRPLRDAHLINDKSQIVIPFAPGKVSRTADIISAILINANDTFHSSKTVGRINYVAVRTKKSLRILHLMR